MRRTVYGAPGGRRMRLLVITGCQVGILHSCEGPLHKGGTRAVHHCVHLDVGLSVNG